MPNVYLVVTGAIVMGGDPDLTPDAIAEAIKIRQLLPAHPPHIICGTGRRQLRLAEALGLTPTRYTPIVGGPEKLLRGPHGDVVMFADGRRIPARMFSGTADRSDRVKDILAHLPENSLVITSRGTTKGILKIANHPVGVTLIELSNQFNQIGEYNILAPKSASAI